MNSGKYTFVVDIPPNFERDVLGGREPAIQLDVDATAMVQAGLGSGYAQQIITNEINDFLSRAEGTALSPVNLVVRIEFNPNVTTGWFSSVMGIINSITMLAIVLAGAAIVREREHGTMDHLVGHAADAVRDRHVRGLGQRSGHHRGGRPLALSRGARAARHSDRRVDTPVPTRCRGLSVFCGPSRRPAAEAISKYILVDMYAKAVQGMAPADAVKWAHGELVKIYA